MFTLAYSYIYMYERWKQFCYNKSAKEGAVFIYKVYMRDIDYIKDNKSIIEVHILQSIHISLIT